MGITKAAQYALKQYGIQIDNLNDLEKFIGPPLTQSFVEFFGFTEQQANEAVDHFRDYYRAQGIFDSELYLQIPELLEVLKGKGKTLVIATSKPTEFAEKVLNHYDLSHYFSLIVGSNLDGTRVSKDEVIKYALDQLKDVNLYDVVMIGDREHDIIGANKNKIDSIGVTYGFGSYEELKNVNPNYIVASVAELLEIFLK